MGLSVTGTVHRFACCNLYRLYCKRIAWGTNSILNSRGQYNIKENTSWKIRCFFQKWLKFSWEIYPIFNWNISIKSIVWILGEEWSLSWRPYDDFCYTASTCLAIQLVCWIQKFCTVMTVHLLWWLVRNIQEVWDAVSRPLFFHNLLDSIIIPPPNFRLFSPTKRVGLYSVKYGMFRYSVLHSKSAEIPCIFGH